ncbi:hypothetical protein ABIA06_006296 [Bradyrhizobium yuanmingense]
MYAHQSRQPEQVGESHLVILSAANTMPIDRRADLSKIGAGWGQRPRIGQCRELSEKNWIRLNAR